MSYYFRCWYVRDDMQEALVRYVHDGVPLGDFLTYVVSNDFQGACGRADDENLMNLPAFAAYVYNEMPGNSHGSLERYKAWIESVRRGRVKPTVEER